MKKQTSPLMLFHPGVRYVNTSAVQKKKSPKKHFIAQRMRNTLGTILAVANFWLFFSLLLFCFWAE